MNECDVLTAVQMRRHQWLGHILRMAAERLVRRAVLALGQRAGPPYQPGSLLMGTPFPLDELVLRAAEDGHATPDPSPPYSKAPEGHNSNDDDEPNAAYTSRLKPTHVFVWQYNNKRQSLRYRVHYATKVFDARTLRAVIGYLLQQMLTSRAHYTTFV